VREGVMGEEKSNGGGEEEGRIGGKSG